MHITYLGHSGFLVEFPRCSFIFDYYVGELNLPDPSKPVFVFASHAHADHYDPKVFAKLCAQGVAPERITAVLSKDIPSKRWPDHITVCKVTFYQTYDLPCDITVRTLHSTDRGVAYLVEHDNTVIFHAGDLNDWSLDPSSPVYDERHNRQMTGSYRHEIDLLADLLEDRILDAAFLPLDPRLGSCYAKGFLYFLKKIRVKKAYPMHYWDKPELVRQFPVEYPQYAEVVETGHVTS
ncbi:MAG: MBL fold metallo-hydrolase [Acetatifactor muris]|nr:MBL fold metallo-hydrolase [Acetatifactor muris]MCM1525700.1 MBL fold metallo-hydrolase [Bacteroides sp.]